MSTNDNSTLPKNFTCGKWNLTEHEIYVQKEHGWWIQGLASIMMGCFGVIVNILLIIVLSSKEFRKVFFNKLIITLTISDILFLVFNVYESLHLYFIETSYCGFAGYLQFISYPCRKITMCFSIYMTVILTFERYSAVTSPIRHRNRLIGSSWTKPFAKYISPVFIVSFLIFGTPLFFAFKMEPQSHLFDRDNISATVAFNRDNISATSVSSNVVADDKSEEVDAVVDCMTVWWRTDKIYILLYNNLTNFIITGAIPFLFLLGFNIKIYLTIKESLKTRDQLNIRKSTKFEHKSSEKNKKTEPKSIDILQTLVLFGLVISFFICHVLRVVLNMEEIIYFEETSQIKAMEEKLNVSCTGVQFWTMIAGDISHFLLQVNSSINFFIYGYISSQFKKALKKKLLDLSRFYSICYTSQIQESETENEAPIPLTKMETTIDL